MRKYLESFLDLFFSTKYVEEELETKNERGEKYSTVVIVIFMIFLVVIANIGMNLRL